jgi:multidrug efflux system outer membrane protein
MMTHPFSSGMRAWVRTFLTLAISSALSGCLLGPDYKRPQVDLPERFNAQTATSPIASAPASAVGVAPVAVALADWWTLFNDPVLNDLVANAQKNNADIQIAVARLGQAQALARQAGAALYPTLNLTASGTRASTGTAVSPSGVGFQTNTAQVGLVTSYELDVWGRVRRNI